jgi:hypothetical protein
LSGKNPDRPKLAEALRLQFIRHPSREVLAFRIRDLAAVKDRQNLIGAATGPVPGQ